MRQGRTVNRVHGTRGRRLDRGQSLIEFAFVVPILLVLVFGIVEFGNAWRHYQLVTNTAREGARLAVLPSTTDAEVQAAIDARLDGSGLDAGQATVTLGLCSGGGGCTGVPDTVTVSYPYQFVFLGPVVDLMCGTFGCGGTAASYTTVQISSTSIMRNE